MTELLEHSAVASRMGRMLQELSDIETEASARGWTETCVYPKGKAIDFLLDLRCGEEAPGPDAAVVAAIDEGLRQVSCRDSFISVTEMREICHAIRGLLGPV
jgi:hypothetical protein